MLYSLVKKADLVLIAVGGWSLAEILSHVNLGLQTLIFLATLIGILWRTFRTPKK